MGAGALRERLRELGDFAAPWTAWIAATLRLPDHIDSGATRLEELARQAAPRATPMFSRRSSTGSVDADAKRILGRCVEAGGATEARILLVEQRRRTLDELSTLGESVGLALRSSLTLATGNSLFELGAPGRS